MGLMQVHSHEPTTRTLHYQLQVEYGDEDDPQYNGGHNGDTHESSFFDVFHSVPIPGKQYSPLDE
eukprot:829561-Karenia_brevis.AAC.1